MDIMKDIHWILSPSIQEQKHCSNKSELSCDKQMSLMERKAHISIKVDMSSRG